MKKLILIFYLFTFVSFSTSNANVQTARSVGMGNAFSLEENQFGFGILGNPASLYSEESHFFLLPLHAGISLGTTQLGAIGNYNEYYSDFNDSVETWNSSRRIEELKLFCDSSITLLRGVGKTDVEAVMKVASSVPNSIFDKEDVSAKMTLFFLNSFGFMGGTAGIGIYSESIINAFSYVDLYPARMMDFDKDELNNLAVYQDLYENGYFSDEDFQAIGGNPEQTSDYSNYTGDTFGNEVGLDDNNSYMVFTNDVPLVMGVSYARPFQIPSFLEKFDWLKIKNLVVGANFNLIHTSHRKFRFNAFNVLFGEDSLDTDSLLTHKESAFRVSLDLGVKFKLHDKITTGLAFKDLFPVDHEWSDSTYLRNDLQIRWAMLYQPASWFSTALEFDLLPYEKYFLREQYLNWGLAFHTPLKNFAFRMGLETNLAATHISPLTNMGFSLGSSHFGMDIGLALNVFETVNVADMKKDHHARVFLNFWFLK